ncbi:MAG: hypothetical protein Kow0084_15990 [Pseudothermotoga elfii]
MIDYIKIVRTMNSYSNDPHLSKIFFINFFIKPTVRMRVPAGRKTPTRIVINWELNKSESVFLENIYNESGKIEAMLRANEIASSNMTSFILSILDGLEISTLRASFIKR